MAWTVLSDATLEVGKALRALTMRNLRDNITAVANGDAGAPQVQTAAIAANAVTAAKIADGNVTTAKIAAGNVTTDRIATGAVAAWSASLATGDVGTYAYLLNNTGATHNPGSTGSNFRYAGTAGFVATATSGTWRCMGYATTGTYTVYLRIA